jgi:hypothetical protein
MAAELAPEREWNIWRSISTSLPLDASLTDFLCAVMRCPDAPVVMRLDAAKNAAVLMHPKPKPVITVVEYERRLQRRRERDRETARRSYARLKAAKAGEAQATQHPSRRRRGGAGGFERMTPRALTP